MENEREILWRSNMPQKPSFKTLRVLDSPTASYTSKNIPNAPNLPCIVCYQNTAAGLYTNCEHRIICLQCAQCHLLSCMQEGEVPRCLVSSCQARIIENGQSIFQRFSQETKRKWKQQQATALMKKNSLPQAIFRPCQFPNCNGSVNPTSQSCPACSSLHCRHCFRLDHQGACKSMSVIIDDEQFKRCKFCDGRLYKEGGCSKMACPTCKRQICYICGEQWSTVHHGCAPGGWIKLPWYYLVEKCCSNDSVNTSAQFLI